MVAEVAGESGFVHKLRNEGRLSEVVDKLVAELAEIMAEHNGLPFDVFTEDERDAMYIAERQLYYFITKGTGVATQMDSRLKPEAEAKFKAFRSSSATGYVVGKVRFINLLLNEYKLKR
ncbi:hypothetical protein EH243_08135 [Amphritea opalescens]|uniref:Uncharacterized protein n=1 Tax=Amphritea opalescens TaxID=2490544 RepID=A0A430KRI5_9GAMM|nr:hypothetical protein [Amphritea opalescens]RTE66080.1 hypothetical protein EH243_08135 [Amphritea opalescens]